MEKREREKERKREREREKEKDSQLKEFWFWHESFLQLDQQLQVDESVEWFQWELGRCCKKGTTDCTRYPDTYPHFDLRGWEGKKWEKKKEMKSHEYIKHWRKNVSTYRQQSDRLVWQSKQMAIWTGNPMGKRLRFQRIHSHKECPSLPPSPHASDRLCLVHLKGVLFILQNLEESRGKIVERKRNHRMRNKIVTHMERDGMRGERNWTIPSEFSSAASNWRRERVPHPWTSQQKTHTGRGEERMRKKGRK
jgi:hypothetical protein